MVGYGWGFFYCDIICLLFHLVPLLDHTSMKSSYTVMMKRCNLFSLFHFIKFRSRFSLLHVGELRPNSVFRLNMQEGVYQCYNFYCIPYVFWNLFFIVLYCQFTWLLVLAIPIWTYVFPICDFNLYGDVLWRSASDWQVPVQCAIANQCKPI